MEEKMKDIIRKAFPLIVDALNKEGIQFELDDPDFIDDENFEQAVEAIYYCLNRKRT